MFRICDLKPFLLAEWSKIHREKDESYTSEGSGAQCLASLKRMNVRSISILSV